MSDPLQIKAKQIAHAFQCFFLYANKMDKFILNRGLNSYPRPQLYLSRDYYFKKIYLYRGFRIRT